MSSTNPWSLFKAEFFKALGHSLRIRILEVLAVGDRSVQELQEALSTDQPTVSQRLAVLCRRTS
ncbi:MAG: ArsR/SmtB family transcription factor [Gemmatimonadota bacterium]